MIKNGDTYYISLPTAFLGGLAILLLGMSGSAFDARRDGNSQAVASGTDNGFAFGDMNASVIIAFVLGGRPNNSFYDAFGFRGLQYRTAEFNLTEETNTETWLDANV